MGQGKGQVRSGALTLDNKDPMKRDTPQQPAAVHAEKTIGDLSGFQVTFSGGRVLLKLAANDGYVTVKMDPGAAWKMGQRLGVASAQSAREMPSEDAADSLPDRIEPSGERPEVAAQLRNQINAEASKARSKGKKK